MSQVIWMDGRMPDKGAVFARNLRYLLENVNRARKPLAFACIGSARIMGDNLGPMIGSILSRSRYPHVFGTMENPLNALTLPGRSRLLEQIGRKYCLIAIDASLGSHSQSGHITLCDSCLYPGAGVSRQLPAVGQLHITGVFDSLDTRQAGQILPDLCRCIGLGLLEICKEERAYFPEICKEKRHFLSEICK